ncbi:response regulator [Nostoc sp. FACHB-888]|uniref:response regulator n=1 Tax=Nostoc sp. FACHB-888 TaxID=2692842 RepID=UPI00168898B1|nr:response regulator [Nostoc sp. FACHB-888]MBD2243210.1 response regulator [Nostoc sp. FACHB-888]
MLPKSSNDVHLKRDREVLEEIPEKKLLSLNGLKVLVVDDNEDCLCVVAFVLEDYQAQIKTAVSADEAIEAIEEWKPDILISDIAMPGKDGYSLIRSVRKKEILEGGFLPAVALTSYAYEDELDHAMDAGFQKLIRKPFEADELITVLIKLTQDT